MSESIKPSYPYRLLTPGPVQIPRDILDSLSEQALHHRTPLFRSMFAQVLTDLKHVFQTQEDVYIITGTGSAAMEAALVNTLSPNDEALCLIIGKFGERWADMAEAYGIKTDRLVSEKGSPIDPATLKLHFSSRAKKPPYKAVLLQACETSTATANDVQNLAKIIRENGESLILVDAITAIGAMPLEMTNWDLDVVVAGSQKAFMMPTGLSFVSLSKRAWKAQTQAKCPRFYFDLAKERDANKKQESYFSSPVHLIRALHLALVHFRGAGLYTQIQRCDSLALAMRTAAPLLGYSVFSKAPAPSVTALIPPSGVNSESLRDWIEKERNLTLMGGQDELKGKILRIGSLGSILDSDIFACLEALVSGLAVLNPHLSIPADAFALAKTEVQRILK